MLGLAEQQVFEIFAGNHIFQAMRAILLASATAASLGGFRAGRPFIFEERPVLPCFCSHAS